MVDGRLQCLRDFAVLLINLFLVLPNQDWSLLRQVAQVFRFILCGQKVRTSLSQLLLQLRNGFFEMLDVLVSRLFFNWCVVEVLLNFFYGLSKIRDLMFGCLQVLSGLFEYSVCLVLFLVQLI